MKDRMNLDHLRHLNGHIGNNSIPINITRGMNEYGQAYTYGSREAADAKNDISEQEHRNAPIR